MKDSEIKYSYKCNLSDGKWEIGGIIIPIDHPLYHNIKIMIDAYNEKFKEEKNQ